MSEFAEEPRAPRSLHLYYAIEISITMLTMGEDVKWHRGEVKLTSDAIQLTVPEYTIELEEIQLVGRDIPAGALKNILKATRQSSYLLIEYNKTGSLGLKYSAQAVFAGSSETIEELKLYFKENIPERVWGTLRIVGDEMRLLYLLFCGIKDMRILVPMFGDMNTLEKLFQSLIRKKLITSKGDLTEEGLARIAEESEKAPAYELGSRGDVPKFDRFFSVWKRRFTGKYSRAARVKVSIVVLDEPLTGFLKVSDLWYVLKLLNIRDFELGMHPVDGMMIRGFFDTSGEVIISPKNNEVLLELVFLIYTIANLVSLSDELKVLNALSLGITSPDIVSKICGLTPEEVGKMLASFAKNRMITPDHKLTPKGTARLKELYNAHRNPLVDRIYPPPSADSQPDASGESA